MFQKIYVFGSPKEKQAQDVVKVSADSLYGENGSYGFVTENSRQSQKMLGIPELNSGFQPFYWYQDERITEIQADGRGCFLDSDAAIQKLEDKSGEKIEGEPVRIPLCFKTDIPRQGNYRVTVTIDAQEDMEDVLIFAERRRLGFRGTIPKGHVLKQAMVVNVCDIIPRGNTEICEDKTLDITIVANRPRITEIEIEEMDCPTIYIAGDSTVTDQCGDYPYSPGTCYCGWGQMLPAFLNTKAAVSNHSHSGLTTETFREEGHYRIVEKYIRKGDYLLIQFGHNDQKCANLKARTGYMDNLKQYIDETKKRGAFPILVTPIARNTWLSDGSYNDLLAENAKVCLELGESLGIPVLDLHSTSMDFVKKLGLEAAKPYYYPDDYTHSNDFGGYLSAGFVAKEIERVCSKFEQAEYRFLLECLAEGYGEWKAADNIVCQKKPAIYGAIENPYPAAELLAEVDRLEETADRASVLDMVVKTSRLVPVYVYNDRFKDVVGHEWYAGAIESACQNQIIPQEMMEGEILDPDKEVTLEEFLIFAVRGYLSKKNISVNEKSRYDHSTTELARPYVRAACKIGLIPEDGSADLQEILTRGRAVGLCRAMKV